MTPPAISNRLSQTSLKMFVLVFREEETKTAAFVIIIVMLMIAFPALSCSLLFTINVRPRACLEIAGRVFLLFLFFWELELMHLPISTPSTAFVVLFLNSQVVFHQNFAGMGLMTLMPIWQKCRVQILEPTKAELQRRVCRKCSSLFWLQNKTLGHGL